jgi:hypothetical protein
LLICFNTTGAWLVFYGKGVFLVNIPLLLGYRRRVMRRASRRPAIIAITLAVCILIFTALSLETKSTEQEAQTHGSEQEREGGEELRSPEPDDNKYFHEPGSDDILGHYDIRYFRGVVSSDERADTLTHLIRGYLSFFRGHGLETWIAHGTLLGWWWNGKVKFRYGAMIG